MRISDWSSDVCSSDLGDEARRAVGAQLARAVAEYVVEETAAAAPAEARTGDGQRPAALGNQQEAALDHRVALAPDQARVLQRSEERRVGNECGSTCRPRWSP